MSEAACGECGRDPSNPWTGLAYERTDLLDVQQELLAITPDDLQGFVEAGRFGPSDDPLTQLDAVRVTDQNLRLVDWHAAEGRIVDVAGRLQYAGGQLYGVSLVQRLYGRRFGEQFQASDTIAGGLARMAVVRSHESPLLAGEEQIEPWQREQLREFILTGGSYLSILNATLDSHIQTQIRAYQAKYGKESDEVSRQDRAAFLMGLLDGAAYCDAYISGQVKESNILPATYEDEARDRLAESDRSAGLRLSRWARWRLGSEAVAAADLMPILTAAEGLEAVAEDEKTYITRDRTGAVRVMKLRRARYFSDADELTEYWHVADDQSVSEAIAYPSVREMVRDNLAGVNGKMVATDCALGLGFAALTIPKANIDNMQELVEYLPGNPSLMNCFFVFLFAAVRAGAMVNNNFRDTCDLMVRAHLPDSS